MAATRQPHDVIISYSSADQAIADAVCAALESSGIVCWIAHRDVVPGDSYAQSIVNAINSARILVLVLSARAAESQHVSREVERAGSKRKGLVTFRIDDSPLTPGLEYFLSESHWLDARAGVEQSLPRLAESVSRYLAAGEGEHAFAADAVPAAAATGAGTGLLAAVRRGNVIRIGLLYTIGSAVLVGVGRLALPLLHLPPVAQRLFPLALALGLPLALFLGWFYERTPEGLRRTREVNPQRSIVRRTRKRLNFAVGVAAAVAVAYAVAFQLWLAPRYASTAESAEEELAAIEASGQSIAVLPFIDLSQAKDQEYLSDGLAEELLNLLAKIPELKVAARTSAFAFKNKADDIAIVAQKLHVANILEGSVRTAGKHVRITAQLIRAQGGYHLWSETYDRDLDDIFKLQDDIAGAVVQALKVHLLSGALPTHAAPKTNDAYNLFLQGRFFADIHTKESIDKAIGFFHQAIALDPGYEPSWSALSFAYSDASARGILSGDEVIEKARTAAAEAIRLDPKSARAHVALGMIHMNYDWDWAATDRDFKQALALDAGNATVLAAVGALDLSLGRTAHAITVFQQAVARDPLHAAAFSDLGATYFADGKLADAEAAFRKSLELKPNASYTHNGLGLVLLERGAPDAALAQMQLETDDSWRLEGIAIVEYARGRQRESDAALAELIKKFSDDDPYVIATVYAYRGEADKAFEWLDKAFTSKDATLASIKVDPLMKKVLPDPRYKALLTKLGLPT